MSKQTCEQMEKCTIKPTPSPTCAGMWEYAPTPTPTSCDPIKEESDEPSEEPKEEPKEETEPEEKIAVMTWDQTQFLQNILNIVPERVGFTFEEFDKIKPLKDRVDSLLMVKQEKYGYKNEEIEFLVKILPILARRGAFNLAEFKDVSAYYTVLKKFLEDN